MMPIISGYKNTTFPQTRKGLGRKAIYSNVEELAARDQADVDEKVVEQAIVHKIHL